MVKAEPGPLFLPVPATADPQGIAVVRFADDAHGKANSQATGKSGGHTADAATGTTRLAWLTSDALPSGTAIGHRVSQSGRASDSKHAPIVVALPSSQPAGGNRTITAGAVGRHARTGSATDLKDDWLGWPSEAPV